MRALRSSTFRKLARNIFDVMKEEGLTSFRILNDWKGDEVKLSGWREEWTSDITWENYTKDFVLEDLPYNIDAQFMGNSQMCDIFEPQQVLSEVIPLIRKGKHREINFFHHTFDGEDIGIIGNIHSTTRGLRNRSHALTAGGIRRHGPGEDFIEVMIDGLNLSRAMSFKNYAAQVPYGGSKICCVMNELDLEDLSRVGFLSFCIDRLRIVTGPDMGFETKMANVMNENFTSNIVGGTGWMETGLPTALCVLMSIKEVCDFLYNDSSLKNRSLAIQGLGVCGNELLRLAIEEENITSPVYISDTNSSLTNLASEKYGECVIVVDPNEILYVDCDVFAPCACGGIINENNIPEMKFDVILGCANNQLCAVSEEEEIKLANLLMENNILFNPDWYHNGGGVACGIEEYENQENSSYDRLKEELQIISSMTRKNVEIASEKGISPTEMAFESVEKEIYI